MDRLEYIKGELRTAPSGLFNVTKNKKELLEFYSSKIEELNKVDEGKFLNHCFVRELIGRCEKDERRSYMRRIKEKIIKLERHQYAPELNCVHTKAGVYKVPGVKTLDKAVETIIYKQSLTTLNKIVLGLG